MEKQRCDRHRYGDGGHGTANSPSFSSTLLDEIYRSIDGNGSNGTAKRTNNASSFHAKTATMPATTMTTSISDLQRGSTTRRNSVNSSSMSSISSSSSTDSCSKRGESEPRYSSSCYSIKRPKPIRTSSVSRPENNNTGAQGSRFERNQAHQYTSGAAHESDFTKKKSKALKIYGDLKRIKQQPISPGARLASFLNSLLGSPKKPKFSNSKPNQSQSSNQNNNYYNDTYRSTTPSSSTCSSATSFSRSCLSKTPSSSSGAKPNGTAKRSVRFYPVSVIVDEECRPCGHKKLYEGGSRDSDDGDRHREEIGFEAARELLKKYQVKKKENDDDNEDDDEDDGGSCASSDLFELDNLSVFELPVYETTNIQIPANSAIF